ncbi:protein of unknown function [Tenacibaculum jejuense]|uniref:Uncharacterized protein n=1 Tax=Tenacibaculum jejuense TaxID=584609 RepID=A0A238UER9_9FLAO|nr:protein of unknown function [Tenacibaculum jejuense]
MFVFLYFRSPKLSVNQFFTRYFDNMSGGFREGKTVEHNKLRAKIVFYALFF